MGRLVVAVQPPRSHSLVFFTSWALRHTPWALQALSMVLFRSPFLGLNRTRHSLTRWMTGPRSCLNTRLKKQSTNWMHVTAKPTDILGGAMNVRQLLFRPTRSLY